MQIIIMQLNENNRVAANYSGKGKAVHAGIEIATIEQYKTVLALASANDITVVFSSTIEFPRDFTRNKKVIALCNAMLDL